MGMFPVPPREVDSRLFLIIFILSAGDISTHHYRYSYASQFVHKYANSVPSPSSATPFLNPPHMLVFILISLQYNLYQ